MTEGIIKIVKGTRMDTETRFRVGHGNAFLCRDMYSVSYALKNSMQSRGWTRKRVSKLDMEMCFRVGTYTLRVMHSKNLCSQKDGLGNVFPCLTWKCVSLSGQVNCDLCIPKICAVKRMDTETCFRVGPRYVFPCQDK